MAPHCEAYSTVGIIIITLSIVVLITSIACSCLNAKSTKVALFMKFNLSFGQRLEVHHRQYDVFVVYNHDSEDHLLVLDEILPLLSKHQLNAVIEDCFALGSDKFTSLQHVMAQSRSALIILSPNLLRANWNLYQLNQAVCTQIEQQNFKVVFLVCAKRKTLGKLPKNLQLFLRISSTVKKYKKNWKGSLIYELKHKTKRSIKKRLSFANTEFRRCNFNRSNEYSSGVDSRIESGRINAHAQNYKDWRPRTW